VKFIHIAPTNLVKYVDENYNKGLNMVLAHEVLENAEYAGTFKKLKGEKYLDNGFFELGYSLSPEEIMEAADVVGATVLICPDGTREGMHLFKAEGYKVMCIPTTEAQLEMMLADEQIDLVGLSAIHFPDRSSALYDLVYKNCIQPKLHILGMQAPSEFEMLSKYKDYIVSWDTSAAIWHGYLGKLLTLETEKDKTPVDFSMKVNWDTIMADNIKFMENQI
jgi:hypothetical protein